MNWSYDDHDYEADRLEYERIRDRFPKLVTVGFECHGGWYPLLERMFEEIRAAIPEGQEHDWHLRQVKEKFGGLRVYWDYGSAHRKLRSEADVAEIDRSRRQIDMAVVLAEMLADRTCDICGSRGWHVVRGQPQGLHMTRCLAHADGGLPTGEPSKRRGALVFSEFHDEIYDMSGVSLAQLLDLEAAVAEEEIEVAFVGNYKGMGDEFDRLSWPGWVDPVPSHLRGRVLPWTEVRPHLHYDLAVGPRRSFHPVTAWTPSWVLTTRRDLNGWPLIVAVPREPARHEQELWS